MFVDLCNNRYKNKSNNAIKRDEEETSAGLFIYINTEIIAVMLSIQVTVMQSGDKGKMGDQQGHPGHFSISPFSNQTVDQPITPHCVPL